MNVLMKQWDEFMNQILPLSSSVAYMTCIGNHERDFPGSGSYYNGRFSAVCDAYVIQVLIVAENAELLMKIDS